MSIVHVAFLKGLQISISTLKLQQNGYFNPEALAHYVNNTPNIAPIDENTLKILLTNYEEYRINPGASMVSFLYALQGIAWDPFMIGSVIGHVIQTDYLSILDECVVTFIREKLWLNINTNDSQLYALSQMLGELSNHVNKNDPTDMVLITNLVHCLFVNKKSLSSLAWGKDEMKTLLEYCQNNWAAIDERDEYVEAIEHAVN